MNKKALKYALVVVGILSLLGWLGLGDTIQGQLLFVGSIVIALASHLIETQPKVTETKVGESTLQVGDVPPVPPKKTKEELEAEIKAKKKAELEKQLAALDKPLPPVPKPPIPPKQVSKEVQCQFCPKVCRNNTDFKRHLAFKHLDKINLKVELE